MLQVKGATGGRSTDLFEESNVHLLDVESHPRVPDGRYVAIGKDNAVQVRERGVEFCIAKFDALTTVNCDDYTNSLDRDMWTPELPGAAGTS